LVHFVAHGAAEAFGSQADQGIAGGFQVIGMRPGQTLVKGDKRSPLAGFFLRRQVEPVQAASDRECSLES